MVYHEGQIQIDLDQVWSDGRAGMETGYQVFSPPNSPVPTICSSEIRSSRHFLGEIS